MRANGPDVARETVHLAVDPTAHAETVTGTVELKAGGDPLTLVLTVPAGPCTTQDVLPVLQGLSSLFAQRGAAKVEAAGKTISCRAGCGACCRQLVPVTGAEARNLATVVERMPPPRRVAVRARFDAALSALDAAGLTDRIRDPAAIRSSDQGMAYFRLGIPCPFLEDEACSIHPDRPLGCREYLVTSPPDQCEADSARRIDKVPLAWDVMPSVIAADPEEGWMPLVFALRYARRARRPRRRPGPDILRAVIGNAAR